MHIRASRLALVTVAVLFCVLLPFCPAMWRSSPLPSSTPAPTPSNVGPVTAEYRAVWVSYLEWQTVDFSSATTFRADVDAICANISALGANVILAQVRPFGDALYPSRYYPFSHLCTGVQGRDPGFDPLAILLSCAHARGLQLEAWCNPYRIQLADNPTLCAASPAVLHPDWVKQVGNDLWLDPASPAVQRHIADAVAELCENYPLDGIHFDDYFYPTTDAAFDADSYALYRACTASPLSLEQWRCANVNSLLRQCHRAAAAHGVRFGVAPQGDAAVALATQYSDAAAWLGKPGLVDYVMPQLYWGRHYTKAGDDSHALENLAAAWSSLPRCDGVELYFGLGAYRIGDGDGGDTPDSIAEWQSGHVLADCAALLQRYGSGVGLYRYDSLFNNDRWSDIAACECTYLHTFWAVNSAQMPLAQLPCGGYNYP